VAGTIRVSSCAQKRNLKRIGHISGVVKPSGA